MNSMHVPHTGTLRMYSRDWPTLVRDTVAGLVKEARADLHRVYSDARTVRATIYATYRAVYLTRLPFWLTYERRAG